MKIKGFKSEKNSINNTKYSENLKTEVVFISKNKNEKIKIIEKRKIEFKYGGTFEIVQKY